jgi:hypothetical protein
MDAGASGDTGFRERDSDSQRFRRPGILSRGGAINERKAVIDRRYRTALGSAESILVSKVALTCGGTDFILGRASGGCSSMVEPQIVVLDVAGSSPVGHPILHCARRTGSLTVKRV